jgi:hypothetical protein
MATKQVRIDRGLYAALKKRKERTRLPIGYMVDRALEVWLGRNKKGRRA